MVGIELPVLGMEHNYLLTEPMPEVVDYNREHGRETAAWIDFEGEIYIRQERRRDAARHVRAGVRAVVAAGDAVGVRHRAARRPTSTASRPRSRSASRTSPPWPAAGIQRIVNGPFTFAPTATRSSGRSAACANYWVACAVMAGLRQGGGVGLALANWMVDGDPGFDIWGDGRRPLRRLGDARLHQRQGARELLPAVPHHVPQRGAAGRPAAAHDAASTTGSPSTTRCGAPDSGSSTRCGSSAPGCEPVEDVDVPPLQRVPESWPRSAAAVRERVGLTECSNFAKYRVSGDGAADWLQGLFTNRLPKVGRIALTAMLNPQGRIVGEFSVARVGDDDFFLFGSQAAEVHHSRWFLDHLPADSRDPLRGARAVARRAVDRRAARARRAAAGDDRRRWRPPTSRSWRSAASTSAWCRRGSGG